jgi:hypothetical protein
MLRDVTARSICSMPTPSCLIRPLHTTPHRRTPLDDAIAEGHLACAKMLLSFGAEHGIPLDDATREKIQRVDLGEVRVMVKKDRVRIGGWVDGWMDGWMLVCKRVGAWP